MQINFVWAILFCFGKEESLSNKYFHPKYLNCMYYHYHLISITQLFLHKKNKKDFFTAYHDNSSAQHIAGH